MSRPARGPSALQRLAAAKRAGGQRAFVAVDPGAHGRAVLFDESGQPVRVYDIADPSELRRAIVSSGVYTVVVESQYCSPKNPPSSILLAQAAGAVVGALSVDRDRPVVVYWVSPSTWQNALFGGGKTRAALAELTETAGRKWGVHELEGFPRAKIDREGAFSAAGIGKWWSKA